MDATNYKRKFNAFSVKRAEWLGLILFIIFEILGLVINMVYFKDNQIVTGKIYLDIIIAVSIVFIGVIIHELIHALCIKIFTRGNKDNIKFGKNLKRGFFYVTTTKEMKAKYYKISLIMPVIITGIIPFFICMILGGPIVLTAFPFLIAAGCGDIYCFVNLLKVKSSTLILDSEDNLGFYELYKEGEEPNGFVETTKENEEEIINTLKEKDQQLEKRQIYIKAILIVLFLAIFVGIMFLLAHLLKFI